MLLRSSPRRTIVNQWLLIGDFRMNPLSWPNSGHGRAFWSFAKFCVAIVAHCFIVKKAVVRGTQWNSSELHITERRLCSPEVSAWLQFWDRKGFSPAQRLEILHHVGGLSGILWLGPVWTKADSRCSGGPLPFSHSLASLKGRIQSRKH